MNQFFGVMFPSSVLFRVHCVQIVPSAVQQSRLIVFNAVTIFLCQNSGSVKVLLSHIRGRGMSEPVDGNL
jgi:hypothetical protein